MKSRMIGGSFLFTVSVLSVIIFCTSCEKEPKVDYQCLDRIELPREENFVGIENISFENYPKVDGSTSASVLNMMIACKLLGVAYRWMAPATVTEWTLHPKHEELPEQYKSFFWQYIKTSQTHGAFMNLINGEADIILTHRTISADEKAHADAIGVTLIETSIALDAFVFVVNKNNPVKSLTVNQIQKIYTKKTTIWSQVGGKTLI
ncbi:MAG: substrate-binding domain-containing protein [Tannerella sp.]|nr:substrate-binding domain-containing protein [Tannerella sp.]